jgi:predicted TIM-barrel fold metal-dependent hydrolase
MSANTTLPKSLHTVTVLMQIARHIMATSLVTDTHAAVRIALKVLYGSDIPADQYGLAVIAARKLATELKRSGGAS